MAIGNWSVDQKTTGGLALVLGNLAGMGASSYLDFNYRKIEAGLRNTYNVLKSNQELIHLVTDAETGQRGYLLTLENRYLESHHTAIKRLAPEVKQLRQLTTDNNQQQRVDALKSLIIVTITLQSKSLEAVLQALNTNQGQQLRQIYKLSNEIAIAENLVVAVVVVKLS